jgi:hypothetical protein
VIPPEIRGAPRALRVRHPIGMMRPRRPPSTMKSMRTRTTAEQLRELRFNMATAALLTRMGAPHLVKHFIEGLEIDKRVRRKRMSPRQRRIRRWLRIGAYAVGVAAAGVAVARMARRNARSVAIPPPEDAANGARSDYPRGGSEADSDRVGGDRAN